MAVAAPARLHEGVAGPTDDVVRGNWASDPWGRYPYRWFDGENWSALVFDGTTQYLDPFVTSIRPEAPASTPATTKPATPATAPATAPVSTPATTQMPITSSSTQTPSAIDTPSLSPWAPGASNGSTASAPPAAAVDRRPPVAATSPTAAPRANPTSVASATTPQRTVGAATRTTTRPSGNDGSADKKRPIWVPVVGVVMVIGFSWWLYNLRGGDDDEFASTDSAEVADSLADATSATTIAPATTLPVTTTTAEVASLPPPVVPDATATGLQDCIEFVPTAAYVQLPWAQELWVAAGSDAAGLPAVCAALPPEQLTEIALRRDEQELATTGSTSPAPTTVAPPADSVAPPITSADESTVPVSPTMPPPLTTVAP